MKSTMRAKLGAVVASLAIIVALSGCSNDGSDNNGTGTDSSSQDGGSGEVLAGSLTELFEQYLSKENLSDFEREVLERAVETGSISQADYDEAVNRYLKCTSDLGYDETATKLASGLYQITPPIFDTDAEADKYSEQSADCAEGTTMVIESLFNQQQNNPDLLADPRQTAVQCLLEGGFVDASYTVDDFDADMQDPGNASFDVSDETANACLAAAGYSISIG